MANYYEQCNCGAYCDEAPCERCRAKQGMTTTNTAQGLLADIIEHPEDDDLRLIYADWLDDHDEEERAEFIRAQVELEGEPELAKIAREYLKAIEWRYLSGSFAHREWAEDVIKVLPHGAYIPDAVIFRRGFIAEVHAPFAVLLQHLPALVRQHPIERVRATDKEPECYAAVSDLWPNHWSWWSNNDNDPSSVQKQVWSLLDGFDPGYTSMDEECKNYPTAEAAHAALSVALLTLARR